MTKTALLILVLAVLLLVIGCSGSGGSSDPAPSGGSSEPAQTEDAAVYINEFLASNAEGLEDEDGDTSDWIELYNPQETAVDLSGWVLTDGPSNRWSFPSISIGSGQYLVVFASGKDRKPSPANVVGGVSNLHTNFQLARSGEYLALQDADGVYQAASLFDPEYPGQMADVSYGRTAGQAQFRYFATPTPGAINGGDAYDGIVADTKFNVDRGFYTDPFELTITTETDTATIRYTLDGSAPGNDHGSVYAAPININGTAVVRAAAYRTDWLPTNVDTQTYIFVDDVLTQSPSGEAPGPGWPRGTVNGQVIDYGMDPNVVYDSRYVDLMDDALLSIASISLVTDLANLFNPGTGIYVNAIEDGRGWERPTSVELIYPDGSDGFQVEAGLRIRGGFSRADFNPKHAFRLFFRSEYGDDKLRYPLFGDEGADQFDKVDLRTAMNYSWSIDSNPLNTMVRDVFNRDAQRDMGQPYTRSRYYHLYINGVYWGLFQTQERPEARYAATYFGGDKDDYDVVKVDSGLTLDINDVQTFRPYTMTATDGNLAAWYRLWQAANDGFDSDQSYFRVQGLNTDGTANSAYEILLDVDNLVDYMLIIFYGGNIDSPITRFGSENVPNNIYAIYNRENPDGFKFFIHDAEHTMLVGDLHGYGDELYTDRTGPFPAGKNRDYSNPQWIHQQLTVHPEYRMRFADRAHRAFFNGGPLTPAASETRFMSRADEINLAIIAESARWGDAGDEPARTKDDDWLPAISDIVDIWIANRTDIVLGQIKKKDWYPGVDAPVFNINGAYQHGGAIAAGELLTMTNGNGSGTIYYSLDGSDPRLRGSYVLSSTTVAAENASKRVLVPAGERSLYQGGRFTVTFYQATIPISSVDTAYSQVIRKPANRSSVASETAAVINYLNTGSNGHYGGDSPFPGTTIGSNVDDFAIEASATVYIPQAGQWTFGVNSDDGFFLSVGGQQISYQWGRAPEDTLAVFNFPAAGAYAVSLVSFERDGGSELELFAAQGSFESWNATDFHLVGDTDNGGLEVLGTAWTAADFEDSAWTSGSGGVGYETDPSCVPGTGCYDDFFDIDVESGMYGTIGSVYLRIPFTLSEDELHSADALTLKMRYDDGFIAYLNGVEVARANAPSTPTWDSVAAAYRDDPDAVMLHEFIISAHVSDLLAGDNMLAIHGLNVSVSSSDFLLSTELVVGQLTGTSPADPQASVYSGGLSLGQRTHILARVLQDGQWSALNEATYLFAAVAESSPGS